MTVTAAPRLFSFRNCIVRVFEETRYLETVFCDGAKVPAAPQDNDEYRATAARLGYGTDTWRMCREHEIAHTVVCEAFGLPHSPTLWAVAHGHKNGIPDSPGEMAAEEALVLAYQAWCLVRGVRLA